MFSRSIQVVVLSAGLVSTALADYTFTTIGYPMAPQTQANGINNFGQIVGLYQDSNGQQHGFLDIGGTLTTLDDPLSGASGGTDLTGINNAGQVVGTYYALVNNFEVGGGFVYSGGAFTAFPADPATPFGFGTIPVAINDAGQIAGFHGGIGGFASVGFLYSNGTFTDYSTGGSTGVGGINNTGQIAGTALIDFEPNGYLYSSGTVTPINYPSADPGYGGTSLAGINDEGQMVGTYYIAGIPHGFLYSNGIFTEIDDPLGADGAWTWVTGINDTGQVVGYYSSADGLFGFLANPTTVTPEPSMLPIAFIAFLGIVGFRMRKRSGDRKAIRIV